MANNYWVHTQAFIANTKVRSSEMNPKLDGIETAFDLLPVAADAMSTGKSTFATETGSGNAYAIAFTGTDVRTVNTTGDEAVFVATHTNTGTPTLDIDTIGAIEIKGPDGATLIAGDIANGVVYVVRFDGTNYQLIGPSTSYITNAALEASYAEEWAQKAEDSAVSAAAGGGAGQFSALHHSAKSAAETVLCQDETTLCVAETALCVLETSYAEEWAQKAEDSPVSAAAGGGAGQFSALHWAAKAAGGSALLRDGSVSAIAPIEFVDGIVTAPSLTFTNETGSGMWSHANYVGFSHIGDLKLSLDAAGVDVTGTLTVTGVTDVPDGAVGTPSYTFTNETGSGMWSHANYVGFSHIGDLKLSLDAAGVDVTGTLDTTDALTVAAGGITITSGDLTVTSGDLTATSGDLTVTSGDLTVTSGDLTITAGDFITNGGAMDLTGGNHTTGDGNVALGQNALLGADADVDHCTAIGAGAGLSNSDGLRNTFIGYSAGIWCATPNDTIALGWKAGGTTAITGDSNIIIGSMAAYTLTEGAANVCIGTNGQCGTTGDFNVVIGGSFNDATSASRNVVIGGAVNTGVATGADNILMGWGAANVLESGSDNIILGAAAGDDLTTGGENVFIGHETGSTVTTGSKNISIGVSNVLNATGATSRIAIGSDLPVNTDNYVYIGNTTNHIYADFNSALDWYYSSDERMKKDIVDADLGLSFINDLRPVTFSYKSPSEYPEEWTSYDSENIKPMSDRVDHGLIAQEVRVAMMKAGIYEFGGWDEQPDGKQAISPSAFVFPLIKAVQELLARIEELEEKANAR
jgi:hypothetical protein